MNDADGRRMVEVRKRGIWVACRINCIVLFCSIAQLTASDLFHACHLLISMYNRLRLESGGHLFACINEIKAGVPSWCYTKHLFDGQLDERRQCKERCSSFNLTCDTKNRHKHQFYCKIPDCANKYQRKSFRTKLNQSATAAEHIHKHFDRQFDMHDCIVLARYLFSSREGVTKRQLKRMWMNPSMRHCFIHFAIACGLNWTMLNLGKASLMSHVTIEEL
eukprot:scaffold19223_cov109-Skeletonema_dohrnii-CCMP3373.AAC.3